MSQANVDVVRRFYELLNARDLAGCAQLLAEDFELVEPSLPDAGVHRGFAGMRRWLERMEDAWSEMHWAPEELIDAEDWVVARVRFTSRGKHTELQQVVLRFQTMRVEDGRIAFATGYGKLARAMAAVGLPGRGSDG
jgi:ketosteroid isomerase-like protein